MAILNLATRQKVPMIHDSNARLLPLATSSIAPLLTWQTFPVQAGAPRFRATNIRIPIPLFPSDPL